MGPDDVPERRVSSTDAVGARSDNRAVTQRSGGPMKGLKVNLMFWVSGLVVGVVLVERWRRTGRILPTPDPVVGAVEVPLASPSAAVAANKQKLPTVLVAGAKADLLHVHRLIIRTVPPAVRRPITGSGPNV
jgi:hypothetical protein